MYPESAWLSSGAPRGDAYDAQLEARLRGQNPHGEADFVEDLLRRVKERDHKPPLICDGGCGTGRVAIELARRGFSVFGVDNDPEMLAVARRKAPTLRWTLGDLATVELDGQPDLVVLAGNVVIFLDEGKREAAVRNLAQQLTPGGLLVAGFQLSAGRSELSEYHRMASAAGMHLLERWATWDRQQWHADSKYAVSVHQLI